MLNIETIGRLHPLLVHLPIGVLLFAAALMVFGRITRADLGAAVSFAWGAGAFMAFLSCGAGWLLARSGDYDADMVQVHQWTGLLTAGLGTLTFLVRKYRWLPASATVMVLSIAGHYGGNLTHGEGYLFSNEEASSSAEESAKTLEEQALVVSDSTGKKVIRRSFMYRDQVIPVFKAKCYSCHSAAKKKGGLRLDTEAFIRKGGKNGSVLTAGNPAKSKLFTYLLLPEGDDRHMPPKGKLQLTRQQIALVQTWIQRGASFKEEIEVIQQSDDDPLVAGIPLLPLTADSTEGVVIEPEKPDFETTLLSRPMNAPDQQILLKLKEQQVSLTKMSPGAEYLSANFVNTRDFKPETFQALQGIQNQVVRLRLTGQPVQDSDLKQLAQFKNLTRLNLENTKITDRSLELLATLPSLEHLNLYGTAVTDTGLAQLAAYPNLKVVYLWQTKATPEGIKRLLKARPDLKIETGIQQLAAPDTNKVLSKK
ncbi:c-type cytochrome domain-containing protein [Dyadobacter sp. LHD-138]|uniref:c-type cytochrome domain-containing protein n=1 Tax=Dyadobacter sp. LHD-138 TaxID=3071413 RepID=UPI0027DF37E9|nr:c-type cytochrome domain-containing protein [Dyadobacter sp. LHD-138]MDQ6481779.1 c-type cytochrome domain-containing protein [Dyadobacter sp. LHD-138]